MAGQLCQPDTLRHQCNGARADFQPLWQTGAAGTARANHQPRCRRSFSCRISARLGQQRFFACEFFGRGPLHRHLSLLNWGAEVGSGFELLNPCDGSALDPQSGLQLRFEIADLYKGSSMDKHWRQTALNVWKDQSVQANPMSPTVARRSATAAAGRFEITDPCEGSSPDRHKGQTALPSRCGRGRWHLLGWLLPILVCFYARQAQERWSLSEPSHTPQRRASWPSGFKARNLLMLHTAAKPCHLQTAKAAP